MKSEVRELKRKPQRVKTAADTAGKMGGIEVTSQTLSSGINQARGSTIVFHHLQPFPGQQKSFASALRIPLPYGSFSASILQGSTPLLSSPTLALNYFLWSRYSLVITLQSEQNRINGVWEQGNKDQCFSETYYQYFVITGKLNNCTSQYSLLGCDANNVRSITVLWRTFFPRKILATENVNSGPLQLSFRAQIHFSSSLAQQSFIRIKICYLHFN